MTSSPKRFSKLTLIRSTNEKMLEKGTQGPAGL